MHKQGKRMELVRNRMCKGDKTQNWEKRSDPREKEQQEEEIGEMTTQQPTEKWNALTFRREDVSKRTYWIDIRQIYR